MAVIQPNEDTILRIPWDVHNSGNYVSINSEPWHFCLLSKIISIIVH